MFSCFSEQKEKEEIIDDGTPYINIYIYLKGTRGFDVKTISNLTKEQKKCILKLDGTDSKKNSKTYQLLIDLGYELDDLNKPKINNYEVINDNKNTYQRIYITNEHYEFWTWDITPEKKITPNYLSYKT